MGESEALVIEESEVSEGWQSGQDLSQSRSGQSYSESDSSVEQSSPDSSQSYSEGIYDLGAFAGYNVSETFGALYVSGIGCGFGIGVCVALAMWALSIAIQIIKKGGQ